MYSWVLAWFNSRIPVFAPFDDRATPPRSVRKLISFYLWPVRLWLAAMFVTSFILALLESGIVLATGWFVDLLARGSPQAIWTEHGVALVGIALALLLVRPALVFLSEALIYQAIVPSVTNRISWQTYLYALGHALPFFQNNLTGRVANHVMQVGSALPALIVLLLDVFVFVAVYATVTVVTFSTISGFLVLPLLLWMVGYGILTAIFVPRMQARATESSVAHSLLIGRIVESYGNIVSIKLFGRADSERSTVREVMQIHTEKWQALRGLVSVEAFAVAIINTLLLVAVAATALWLWTLGRITPGETAAGLALVARLQSMSSWFMHVTCGLFDYIGLIRDSMQSVSRPHDVVDKPNAPPLIVTEGEVEFREVSFRYGGNPAVFDGLTLRIAPGESIGLVGPSGSGKSTLINLLLRFYDLERGQIMIDGQDIASVSQDSLRRQIAVVAQETPLLHGSIRDNIAYGRDDATDAEIECAATLAHAHDFILGLRDPEGRHGYDCHVGERGARLSGGERQRIAIARAILKRAPIVLLDEATSSLDSEIEAAIDIAGVFRGRTMIAIAHRLSTLAGLDRLLVLDQGRIVEEGNHAGLMAVDGLYATLWRTGQMGPDRARQRRLAGPDKARAAPTTVAGNSQSRYLR